MISNAIGEYNIEPVSIIAPTAYAGPVSEPFEAELRSRLHDILEDWEERALEEEPELRAAVFSMIDQISDAMYPPED